ncbi:MAG: deoxyribonuclease IV [Methanomicrobia archaeon]|nr:deoxyribonuclease IV [Methanomicrobia archaeon]
MIHVGVHVSIAGSIDKAVDRAQEKGCDTFQIFSRNPRGWKIKPLSDKEASRFVEKLEKSGIYPPVDHMPYLPNLAAPPGEVYDKSIEAVTAELQRCGELQIPYLVTHLGSHRGSGEEEGLQQIVSAINTAFREVENGVMLLLENTADTKNSMGGTFEHIRRIIDQIEQKDRIGICFDTCHAFVAGYELRTKANLEKTLQHFDDVLGLEQLTLIHLNDAKGGLGSKLDRHEHIGLGYIGEDGFRVILHDERIIKLPIILETPVDDRRGDSENLQKVRELAAH